MCSLLRVFTLVALLSQFALAQFKVEVVPFSNAVAAKAVTTEVTQDRVIVFFDGREAKELTGAWLTITSEYKWALPYNDAGEFSKSQTMPGKWLMLAKPGKYRVVIFQFDPDKGPQTSAVDVVVPGAVVIDPDDPPPVDPPPIIFESLIKQADELADALADQPTRAALSRAYEQALQAAIGKSLVENRTMVTMARAAVMSARTGSSRTKDWNTFLLTVDKSVNELTKDLDSYRMAIAAVIAGLSR